jgi:hypothetical protein
MTDNLKSPEFSPPAGFNKMSDEQKKQTYTEWAKQKYNEQYENWMPWIEDNFLRYFTKDNKASYATKRKFPTVSPTFVALAAAYAERK